MVKNSDTINTGGSAFWILITLTSLISLVFIMIWGYQNNSIQAIALALVFFAMIASSAILSRLKVFDWASFGDNALSFMIGFLFWLLLGITSSFSVLSQNHLFASIASELPILLEFSTSVFLIPIAEEMFWMVGLPFALITIMDALGKRFSFWKSGFVQIPVIILIGAISFAYFHVGKLFIGFIIVALIFRTILLFLVYGEHYFNIIKGVNLVAGFSIGAHIANNLVAFGLRNAWLTFKSNFFIAGLLMLLFMGTMLVLAIDTAISYIRGEGAKDKKKSLAN